MGEPEAALRLTDNWMDDHCTTQRQYFDHLLREAAQVLLAVDRPYVAHRLMQLRAMALAVWPDAADPCGHNPG
jgi:hypothetical protein